MKEEEGKMIEENRTMEEEEEEEVVDLSEEPHVAMVEEKDAGKVAEANWN